MTNAEVLVIIDTKTERKIWASDKLLDDYRSGKLGPKANNETYAEFYTDEVSQEEECSLGVPPLEPTPEKVALEERLQNLYGHSYQDKRPTDTLNIPTTLREVLKRPRPQITPEEMEALLGSTQTTVNVSLTFVPDEIIPNFISSLC